MRSTIRISRSALVHNARVFRRIIPRSTQLMAVVKSNGYGHGMALCARVFDRTGADWFGVANVREALELRKTIKRKPILVLSYLDGSASELQSAVRLDIRLPAYTLPMLAQYNRLGATVRMPVRVHVKLDTGTTRIGFLPREMPRLIQALRRYPHIQVEGVYSHFAEVEARNQSFSNQQRKHFFQLATTLEAGVGERLIKHLNCSAGVLEQPDADADLVRIGMSLYGIWTVANRKRAHRHFPTFSLHPALEWVTDIIQVKAVPPGTTVGYNRTFRMPRGGTIGVLPVGYWDGLSRSLSNRGYVMIRGQKAPIRGRVCMNLTMVQLSPQHRARVGTPVVLIGKGLSAERVAELGGTIPYDVLSRLPSDIPRILVA